MRYPPPGYEPKRIQTYNTDETTSAHLQALRQPGEYSALIRELINERYEQETITGLRAAVVKLMADYRQQIGQEA